MRAPITATGSLARRIDHAELFMVNRMADAARAAGVDDVGVWPVGGAVAVLAEAGSPFNKLIGLGFAPLDEAALAQVEREHRTRGARLQVELSTLSDPSVPALLTGRGYRLIGFENVLARALEGDEAPATGEVEAAPLADGEAARWADTLTTAFLHPDVFDGPAAHESFDRVVLERTYDLFGTVPGVARLLARLDGQVAGGASLFLHDGIALMCGAATLPAWRRRGVQSALLAARLAFARAQGCDLAVVTTQPGSKSQANVQRAGFQLIYSRAILVLDPGE